METSRPDTLRDTVTAEHQHQWQPAPVRGPGYYECACGGVGLKDLRHGIIKVLAPQTVKNYARLKASEATRNYYDYRDRNKFDAAQMRRDPENDE